jgi:hypothetical protein
VGSPPSLVPAVAVCHPAHRRIDGCDCNRVRRQLAACAWQPPGARGRSNGDWIDVAAESDRVRQSWAQPSGTGLPESGQRWGSGNGRLPMAANGCFVDARRVEPRLGCRAALGKFEGQLRVGSCRPFRQSQRPVLIRSASFANRSAIDLDSSARAPSGPANARERRARSRCRRPLCLTSSELLRRRDVCGPIAPKSQGPLDGGP